MVVCFNIYACVLAISVISFTHISVMKNLWFTNSKLKSTLTTSCKAIQVGYIIGIESCSAALCDNPVDIDNGMATFTGNSIGDEATYTCDLGFELIGNTSTICTLLNLNSAEFQPAPPLCRREYTKCLRITKSHFMSILVACCAFVLWSHSYIY